MAEAASQAPAPGSSEQQLAKAHDPLLPSVDELEFLAGDVMVRLARRQSFSPCSHDPRQHRSPRVPPLTLGLLRTTPLCLNVAQVWVIPNGPMDEFNCISVRVLPFASHVVPNSSSPHSLLLSAITLSLPLFLSPSKTHFSNPHLPTTASPLHRPTGQLRPFPPSDPRAVPSVDGMRVQEETALPYPSP